MGINLGKIGFMTEIEIDDMEDAISKFLQDDFTVEKRMMMKAEIRKENKIQFSFHALNDVVVSKVAGEKLIYMELSTDGVAVNRYTADGLIIATPTGSTGYSISAGGPAVDPKMHAIIQTPICAHSLHSRPILFDAGTKLFAEVSVFNGEPYLTADGYENFRLADGDIVQVERSKKTTKIIRLKDMSFYEILNRKLG